MPISISQIGTQSWVSTGAKSISISGISAGDVLAFVVGAGDENTTVSSVTDNLGGTWTAGPSSPVGTGNMRGVTFWKIAAGGETSISFTIGTGTTGQAIAVKATGFSGTATLEGSSEDESKLSTVSTSVGSGSAANSTATGVAIALFASDRWDTVEDVSRSYSNSFTEVGFVSTSGSRAGAFAAGKVLSSAASQSTTFTTGDTGDEMYAALLVFGDDTGGSSHDVAATCDALTLAEYAATIGKSLNISAGVDALTLTEYAASVGSVLDIQATTDALTLAEYQATIGLSLNVQANVDALTLTEYAATLGSTHNVNATTDALVLAEHAAAIGLSLNISATVDALTLTEYGATISDASAPEVAPAAGGHYFPRVKVNDWRERSAKQRREYLERLLGLVEGLPEAVEEEAEALIEAQGIKEPAQIVRLDVAKVNRLIAQIERIIEDEDETLFLLMAS